MLLLLVASSPWLARAAEPAEGMISLTDGERAWIAAHPDVVVAHDPTYAPFAFPGPDGQLVGLDPDYLALIARRTGLRFRNIGYAVWEQAITDFKAGKVDLLPSIGHTVERESFMIFTEPYTSAPNMFVTRTDTPYLLDVRELKGRRVGVPRGYAGLQSLLRERVPDCIVVEYANMHEALAGLARGETYASVADLVNAAYTIRTQHLTNLRLGSVIPGDAEIYLGVRKNLPELASILNKALASLTPLEHKQVDDRWVGVDVAPDRWANAFKVASVVAAVAVVVFLLVFLHNRRLASELTERRRIQHELEKAHTQLARVSEEKSELLRMVAHDLRSPLTGFLLGVDLLQSELDPDNRAAATTLTQMRTSTRQMMRLTNDLVDVHMLEEGKRDYQRTEVDLSALLHEAVAAYSERAALKRIRLRLETETPAMPLRSDAAALRQVADNLISNALKYSPADTEVLVCLGRTASGYRLTIADHGPGIGAADREKLFQKYVRGSAQPTGGEKATGLGLWIVRRFMDALHGRVWHEPGPDGKGSVFIVELPLVPPPVV
jgi:signal transduction histidine kinase